MPIKFYKMRKFNLNLASGCVYVKEGDSSGDQFCFEKDGDHLSSCLAGEFPTNLVQRGSKLIKFSPHRLWLDFSHDQLWLRHHSSSALSMHRTSNNNNNNNNRATNYRSTNNNNNNYSRATKYRTINNGTTNNRTNNNRAINNGATNNSRTTNNGTTNNRTINNGTTNNRTINNGTTNNGATNNSRTTNNGAGNNSDGHNTDYDTNRSNKYLFPRATLFNNNDLWLLLHKCHIDINHFTGFVFHDVRIRNTNSCNYPKRSNVEHDPISYHWLPPNIRNSVGCRHNFHSFRDINSSSIHN